MNIYLKLSLSLIITSKIKAHTQLLTIQYYLHANKNYYLNWPAVNKLGEKAVCATV